MFQLKDFRSILAGMVNRVRAVSTRLTDFHPGSVTRTLLEASAIEIEELYLQMYHGIIEAIPVAIYGAFDFSRRPAAAAYGYVTFSRATAAGADYPIPAGTAVATATGLSFVTADTVTLATGQTAVQALAVCAQAGVVGNVAAGSISVLTTSVTGIEAVTNAGAFTTGADAETEAQRKDRFREYIATLARGTRAALVYAAKLATVETAGLVTERVTQARIIEYDDDGGVTPIGIARVVIHNGASAASGALVERAQAIIDGYQNDAGEYVPGYKAAGVLAPVEAASLRQVAVTETLFLEQGFDAAAVAAAVEAAQTAYFAALGIGDAVLRAELIAAAMGVPGVYDCTLTDPASNTPMSLDQVAVPGVFTVTTA